MIESPVYFKAIQPALEWMKDTDVSNLTLYHEIMTGFSEGKGNGSVNPPAYLQAADFDINLGTIYKDKQFVHGNILGPWPGENYPENMRTLQKLNLELDASQEEAMKHILNNKIALVQGPPGTGKSYIGVKAIQLIHQVLKKQRCFEPIMVICLTNHALDQFLLDLLPEFPNLVRFGSRCKTPELSSRSINEVIYHARLYKLRDERRQILHDIEDIEKRLNTLWRLRTFSWDLVKILMLESMPEDFFGALMNLPSGPSFEDMNAAGIKPNHFMMDCITYWKQGNERALIKRLEQDVKNHKEKFKKEGVRYLQQISRFRNLDEAYLKRVIEDNNFKLEMVVKELESLMLLEDSDDEDDEERSTSTSSEISEVLSVVEAPTDTEASDTAVTVTTAPNEDVKDNSDDNDDDMDEIEKIAAERGADDGFDLRIMNEPTKSIQNIGPAENEEEKKNTNRNLGEKPSQKREDEASQKRLRKEAERIFIQEFINWRDGKNSDPQLLERFINDPEEARSTWVAYVIDARYNLDLPPHVSCDYDHSIMDKVQDILSDSSVPIPDHLQNLDASYSLFEFTPPRAPSYIPLEVSYAFEEAWDEIIGSERFSKDWPYRLSKEKRKELLDIFKRTLQKCIDDSIQKLLPEIEEQRTYLEQVKHQSQYEACRDKPIIGMTSTYAAMNQRLFKQLKPKIIICEEAGELLEAQTIPCLSSEHLEHLILIGDHQQLRPKVNNYTLCKRYHFDISLFERLIGIGASSSQLVRQHRMRSDFCDLIRGFYKRIEDHPSVHDRPVVKGIQHNLYFLTHAFQEDQSMNSLSKSNSFEAEMCAKLAFYLYQQGFQQSEITIITPYLGQKRMIRRFVRNQFSGNLNVMIPVNHEVDQQQEQVRVVTIDDYQGEENRIIILSLVRSNKEHRIGFVGIENRVIVALSRAREGMYIIGNDNLLQKNESWQKVFDQLQAKGCIGKSLKFGCQRHPQEKIEVQHPRDFDKKMKFGGCQKMCRERLECGHSCKLLCHPFDHSRVRCYEPCERPRLEGCTHKCKSTCFSCQRDDRCPPCLERVKVKLSCGHFIVLPCHQSYDLAQIRCMELVPHRSACGHTNTMPCYIYTRPMQRASYPCSYTEHRFLECGHFVTQRCSNIPSCAAPCEVPLECGHPCPAECGSRHSHERENCQEHCDTLLICGHQCSAGCKAKPNHTSSCRMKCQLVCLHGVRCNRICFQECNPCKDACPWRCRHLACSKLCHEECDRPPCNEPCTRRLRCGHICIGLCGEFCPPCHVCDGDIQCSITQYTLKEFDPSKDRAYMLPDCRHTFDLEGLDQWFNTDQGSEGHKSIQLLACPNCRTPVYRAMRYNRQIKRQIVMLNRIKKRNEEVSAETRRQIMQEVTRAENVGAGHWYACPNGHPYFIADCGGAMEVSNCPDCNETVGGQRHRLEEGNTPMYFDGPPAWPV